MSRVREDPVHVNQERLLERSEEWHSKDVKHRGDNTVTDALWSTYVTSGSALKASTILFHVSNRSRMETQRV